MNEFALAFLTFFLLPCSVLCYSWIFNKTAAAPPLPPGPRGLPILGYLPFLNANLHHQFTKLAHKHGPIYKLWLGSKLCVVISSPPLIKQVVRDQDAVFANRDPPIAVLIATGGVDIAWSPNGPYWREMRKLFVRELLSNNSLQASYELRRSEVRKVIRDLSTKIGRAVGIGELIFLTELNVIMRLLWGSATESIGSEFCEKITKLTDLAGRPNASDFFPVLAKFDVQGIEKEMRVIMAVVERILDSVIDERMKSVKGDDEKRRKDFLEILLELKQQQVGERSILGPTQIKAIFLDIIVGGIDTTGTIVEWVMAELLHNPSVMQRVQEELTYVVGVNNNVEESHLSELHYLDAVVKETFRLHSPVPLLIPKCPSESCTIGGYTIPKGSRIYLNMWSIYMDPNVWDNPLEFQPERFMNDSGKKFDYAGNSFEYLPFGSGRRACPGIPLAKKMVMYLLATLIHLFEWRLPEGENIDLSEKFGIVMRKETPLIAIPYHRLANMNLYA